MPECSEGTLSKRAKYNWIRINPVCFYENFFINRGEISGDLALSSIPVTGSTITRFLPYEVGRIAVRPGTKPYIFQVKLGRGALPAVGLIARIGQVFADLSISILQLKVSSIREVTRVIIIADLKERENLMQRILEELKKLEYCEEVSVIPPIAEGIAIDTLSFPLLLGGKRAVIMRDLFYEGLFKSGWERFGVAYSVLLYSAGFDAGRSAFRHHRELSQSPELIVKIAEALFQMLGYGVLEILKIDDASREAVARVYSSFECELFKGSGEARGSFVRGMLAGWFAERWGVPYEEVVAREYKCIARGDEYCEYVISVKKKEK